jgi:uncharacterized protein
MGFRDRMERVSSRFYDAMRSSKARDGESTAGGFEHLRGHKYALLVTYKRSGEGVPTPIWFGLDARGHAYVRTGEQAAKVKRIRNDPRVKLAPCTVRGKPLGPYAQGTARVVTPEEVGDAEQAIQENYGLGRTLYERSAASFEAHYIEVVPT